MAASASVAAALSQPHASSLVADAGDTCAPPDGSEGSLLTGKQVLPLPIIVFAFGVYLSAWHLAWSLPLLRHIPSAALMTNATSAEPYVAIFAAGSPEALAFAQDAAAVMHGGAGDLAHEFAIVAFAFATLFDFLFSVAAQWRNETRRKCVLLIEK